MLLSLEETGSRASGNCDPAVARLRTTPGALGWEARATLTLFRLRELQGREAEGRAALALVVGRFGEGLGSRDLRRLGGRWGGEDSSPFLPRDCTESSLNPGKKLNQVRGCGGARSRIESGTGNPRSPVVRAQFQVRRPSRASGGRIERGTDLLECQLQSLNGILSTSMSHDSVSQSDNPIGDSNSRRPQGKPGDPNGNRYARLLVQIELASAAITVPRSKLFTATPFLSSDLCSVKIITLTLRQATALRRISSNNKAPPTVLAFSGPAGVPWMS